MEGRFRKLIAVCVAGLCSLVLAAPAQADFLVDNSGDATDPTLNGSCDTDVGGTDDTPCTLRAAVEEANNTAALDTITFAGITSPNLTGTITTLEPTVIDGNGPFNTAIDGDDTFRLFLVNGDPVTFKDLNLRHGSAAAPDGGGAIKTSNDDLTLDNVILFSNQVTGAGNGFGGAIYNDDLTAPLATVTITNSLISSNMITSTGTNSGGGIYSQGPLNVTDTTVRDNMITTALSTRGGGLTAATDLNVQRSTISGNSLASGTATGTSGGGIHTIGALGTQTISNSTISNNTAGDIGAGAGGGVEFDAAATVTGSTFTNNVAAFATRGEDIDSPVGTVTVKDTILTSGGMAGTACAVSGTGTIVSAGTSIDRGMSCGFGTANGNQQNTDPMLDALDDYGGPSQTHRLMPGSPAIGAGSLTGLATDQRGVARPQGTFCDIGAFELEAANDAPSCAGFPAVLPPPVATPTPTAAPPPAKKKKCKKKKKKGAAAAKKCKKKKRK